MANKRITKVCISKKAIQARITKWCIKQAKKINADCLIAFEDLDKRRFYFKYDGFIYECLYYSGQLYNTSIDSFDKLFINSGWSYDYEDASVMIIFKD